MKLNSIQILFLFLILGYTVLSSPVKYKEYKKYKGYKVKGEDSSDTEDDITIYVNNNNKLGYYKLTNSDSDSDTDDNNNDNNTVVLPDEVNYYNSTLDWSYTPEKIEAIVKNIVEDGNKIMEEIMAIPENEATFEAVFNPYMKIQDLLKEADIINFLLYVHEDDNLKYIANEQLNIIDKESYTWDIQIHEKAIEVIKNINNEKVSAPQNPEDLKYLEMFEKENKKMGLGLSNENNEKYANYQARLNNIQNEFYGNLSKGDKSTVTFTKKELEGVSESIINKFQKTTKDNEEAYIILVNSQDASVISSYAVNENTRKEFLKVKNQSFKANVDLLKETANLRLKLANVLGYKSFSDYFLQDMMAKSPENVFNFLESLKEKLQPLVKNEFGKLLELKKMEKEELNEPFDNTLNFWDIHYYTRLLKEQSNEVDLSEINEYFPINDVVDEILNLYGEFLSVKCVEVKNPSVWHPDVRQFEVYDRTTNNYIGSFFLDLYLREGKYSGTGSIYIKSGYDKIDGTHEYPASTLITNIQKSSSQDIPTLLSHDDICVLIHELGHIFHQIIAKTKWVNFKSSNVEGDFLEAPALLMENWAWEPEVLKRISHHYQNPEKKIPMDLIDAILKSKESSVAKDKLYQVFISYVDLKFHSLEIEDLDVDVAKIWNDGLKDIYMVESIEDTWQIGKY
eukprot:jgi/Orpsp1_1/1180842/evm.model.c7180000074839.1